MLIQHRMRWMRLLRCHQLERNMKQEAWEEEDAPCGLMERQQERADEDPSFAFDVEGARHETLLDRAFLEGLDVPPAPRHHGGHPRWRPSPEVVARLVEQWWKSIVDVRNALLFASAPERWDFAVRNKDVSLMVRCEPRVVEGGEPVDTDQDREVKTSM